MNASKKKIAIVSMDEPVIYCNLYRRLIDSVPNDIFLVILLPSVFESGGGATDLSRH